MSKKYIRYNYIILFNIIDIFGNCWMSANQYTRLNTIAITQFVGSPLIIFWKHIAIEITFKQYVIYLLYYLFYFPLKYHIDIVLN